MRSAADKQCGVHADRLPSRQDLPNKIADNAADKFRRYGALLAAGNVILKDVFGKRSGNGLVDEFCISKHAVQTAFKVADVGINPFRNKAENFIADVKIS